MFKENPTYVNRIVIQKARAEYIKYLKLEESLWKKKKDMIGLKVAIGTLSFSIALSRGEEVN